MVRRKSCRILDPFGNLWWINQRVEEFDFTNPQEIQRKASTPEAKAGIAYIQQSLNDALKAQKLFFEKKTVPIKTREHKLLSCLIARLLCVVKIRCAQSGF